MGASQDKENNEAERNKTTEIRMVEFLTVGDSDKAII